jgi:phenylacetate-CoA ligase
MFAMLQYLGDTQWLDPDTLREQQFRQLERLLGHAYDRVPFYRQRLDGAGYRPDKPLTAEIWRAIPTLLRSDLQSHGDALLSPELPPRHGPIIKTRTSGSTGMPIEAQGSQITQFFAAATTLRNHLWHGRDLSGTLASIRVGSDLKMERPEGTRQKQWGPAEANLTSTGPVVMLDLAFSIEHQAEWLQGQNPHYLNTCPTNLRHLAAFCLAKGIELPNLREATTATEALDAETRALCRKAWNVGVTDTYSTQECGAIALQCPKHEHYHVQCEHLLVEVLDGERPCGPGEIGRVVVTPLHNFAMPLIREEIGDYAQVGEACDCGRGLPVLKRIMGRVRNLVTLPSGERHWPLIGGRGLTDAAPIRQFQLVQTSLEHVEVRLVVHREVTTEEEASVKDVIRDRLRHPFDLTVTYHDEIPRGPGGKFEDFRSELPQ